VSETISRSQEQSEGHPELVEGSLAHQLDLASVGMNVGKTGYVYIMTNRSRSSVYIGVTSDLERRVWQHKAMTMPGFTARYRRVYLVLIEEFSSMDDAIAREKQLKNWSRSKKDALISADNPAWSDLSAGWQ
jgi:putative endonuclease